MRIGNQAVDQSLFLRDLPTRSPSKEARREFVSKIACSVLSECNSFSTGNLGSRDLDVSKEDSEQPKSPKESKWPNPFKRPTKPFRPPPPWR